ncbi:cation diffusion facilitator family transporter [Aureimonas phyllosphaerae]|uniref:Cobalt-zinc-cadmium efflux system protein n=1 Tax=Aureimonas phyllosphaerae TaxID=1166078 RepID=A0A7W6BL55_9HYPH|nr:cation diffusion facilitator family transporter [Aureimonas phyllosphaerae]MBB3933994.1 cobalt-zinc-cadmium efflux system protein [Aureimonas phyllosphaerae]MBB3958790.1 cobalt-zinc-cadmium efflux system protein [Aureimonas phyllosphaerae]
MSDHHGHSHDHGDHDHHDHAAHASHKRLGIAAALTGLFMLAEIAGGLISGSLALLADAGHMFVDFAGLVLAFAAARLALRPADAKRSYGYDRFQILVAYSNGLVLFGITAVIVYEAWRRFTEPVEILAGPMLVVAVAGLLVNIAAFYVLHGGDKEDLNMRGALLHVLGDLLGSVAAIVASLVILATGWTQIDPILSVLVCLLILTNAWRLVRESAHVLLEGAPAGVDGQEVGRHLRAAIPGIEDVHHVHVWMITPRRRAATLHVCVPEGADGTAVVRRVKAMLSADFRIEHATVELEHGHCADAGSACGGDHVHDHAGHDHAGHNHAHHHHAHDHGHRHDHGHHGHDHAHGTLPRPA